MTRVAIAVAGSACTYLNLETISDAALMKTRLNNATDADYVRRGKNVTQPGPNPERARYAMDTLIANLGHIKTHRIISPNQHLYQSYYANSTVVPVPTVLIHQRTEISSLGLEQFSLLNANLMKFTGNESKNNRRLLAEKYDKWLSAYTVGHATHNDYGYERIVGEDKPGMRQIFPMLLPQSVVCTPYRGDNSQIDALLGRGVVVNHDSELLLKRNENLLDAVAQIIKIMFTETLIPLTDEQLNQHFTDPSKKLKLDTHLRDEAISLHDMYAHLGTTSFVKLEPHVKLATEFKNRNITNENITNMVGLTRYTVPYSKYLAKIFPGYAFGCSTQELGTLIHDYSNKYATVCETDYSAFDGTQNSVTAAIEWIIYNHVFDGDLEPLKIKEDGWKSIINAGSVLYTPNYSRHSGAADTSCMNTTINLIVIALTHAYAHDNPSDKIIVDPLSVHVALNSSICGGDDGLAYNIDQAKYEQIAAHMGLVLKVETKPTSHPLNMLARIYPNPQESAQSGVDIKRALSRLPFAPNSPFTNNEALFLKSCGYLTTDFNTPIFTDIETEIIRLIAPTVNMNTVTAANAFKSLPYSFFFGQPFQIGRETTTQYLACQDQTTIDEARALRDSLQQATKLEDVSFGVWDFRPTQETGYIYPITRIPAAGSNHVTLLTSISQQHQRYLLERGDHLPNLILVAHAFPNSYLKTLATFKVVNDTTSVVACYFASVKSLNHHSYAMETEGPADDADYFKSIREMSPSAPALNSLGTWDIQKNGQGGRATVHVYQYTGVAPPWALLNNPETYLIIIHHPHNPPDCAGQCSYFTSGNTIVAYRRSKMPIMRLGALSMLPTRPTVNFTQKPASMAKIKEVLANMVDTLVRTPKHEILPSLMPPTSYTIDNQMIKQYQQNTCETTTHFNIKQKSNQARYLEKRDNSTAKLFAFVQVSTTMISIVVVLSLLAEWFCSVLFKHPGFGVMEWLNTPPQFLVSYYYPHTANLLNVTVWTLILLRCFPLAITYKLATISSLVSHAVICYFSENPELLETLRNVSKVTLESVGLAVSLIADMLIRLCIYMLLWGTMLFTNVICLTFDRLLNCSDMILNLLSTLSLEMARQKLLEIIDCATIIFSATLVFTTALSRQCMNLLATDWAYFTQVVLYVKTAMMLWLWQYLHGAVVFLKENKIDQLCEATFNFIAGPVLAIGRPISAWMWHFRAMTAFHLLILSIPVFVYFKYRHGNANTPFLFLIGWYAVHFAYLVTTLIVTTYRITTQVLMR
uniref:RNA-dependent RNA polymerase n=1 Tax=Luoyang Nodav tick virus 1 TaxID=2972252 RepID=A0A9E7V1Y0_9VIRU|nr:MAG: RNA-dependent RNA polymerase [Luoyang Nodav tick virus 1]